MLPPVYENARVTYMPSTTWGYTEKLLCSISAPKIGRSKPTVTHSTVPVPSTAISGETSPPPSALTG